MAYALRYYKEIAQTDGGVVRLEIHKKDSTTSAVEIGAVVQGLSLEIQGQQDDIDTPIQKTSLHMTFVDASDIENGQKNGFWEEFYTPDALLWRVVLKAKDAGETSFRTIWGGYVTPDSFSEDLVYRGSVSITARDNIGHMQDFPFDALGDEDGLISLFNLVSMGWEKIQSPMDLSWNGLDWLSCNDVIAYHTLMNVSQFKDMNWYKAIETALASYGAVMRYAGENEVYVTTLRYMPSLGRNIDLMDRIDPTFIAGATRELVPAVKRIEENVEYELEESVSQPQIKVSDFSGSTETYRCKIDGVDNGNGSFGTAEHDAPIWSINNNEIWSNNAGESLFFNPHAYEIGYFSNYRGLGDEIRRFMYIAANNVDERSVSFSKTITCADLAIRIKFGLPISLNSESGSMTIEQQNVFNLKSIRYSVTLVQNGVTNYLASHGGWVVDKQEITTEFDTSSQVSDFECVIGMGEFLGHADLTFTIHKIEYAQMSYANLADYGLYACIQDFALATPTSLSLREKNTVNTVYNADNNVILSRDPELGPAFDKVALPGFIKNGIFYRSGDEILPARLWSWGGSEQQMAVWNHLQLLCYYAKPNNLISGTIVNADITRVAAIYEWNHAEHILVSGRYNFLNGHIEGAVLREFARYEDMWSEVAGAAMPETEQDSRSNVEGGASSSASPSTYTATQNVNIGTGGGGGGTGASNLNDLQDVDTTGVVAQSVLYYNGTSWVDMSFASLVNPLLNPYLKAEVASSTYATKEALNGLETAISANATAITGLGTRMTNAENAIGLRYTKQETNNLLAKYLLLESANQTIKGNITIEGNLIIRGDTSSTAKGTDAGVAGTLLGIKVNGTTYDNPVNGILTIPDYPTSLEWSAINGKPTNLTEFTNDAGFITSAALNGYAKTSDLPTKSSLGLANVENKSSATIRGEITSANVTNALGYTPANNASLATYLPLSGGTISGTSVAPLLINTSALDSTVVFQKDNASKTQIGYSSSVGSFIYNYASGKSLGIKDDGTPYYNNGSYNTLIHSGNYSDYALKVNPANINLASDTNVAGYGQTAEGWPVAGPALLLSNSVGNYAMMLSGRNGVLRFNTREAGNLTGWKTIAFTDSNVASATKLATARTIWGQSFDGTGNVSGTLSINRNANTGAILDSSTMALVIEPYASVVSIKPYTTGGTLLNGIHLNSSGNATIGASDLAGTSYKFAVNGNASINISEQNPTSAAELTRANTFSIQYGIDNRFGLHSWLMSNGSACIQSCYAEQYQNRTYPLILNPFGSSVLIGTTTDSGYKLDVNGDIRSIASSAATRQLVAENTNASFGLGVNASGGCYLYTAQSVDLNIYTAGAIRMTIASNGAVTMSSTLTVNGNVIFKSDTATGSDIRFKDIIDNKTIDIKSIAEAPLFTFKWNDREDDSVHLGTSAQYWEKVAPWLVKGEDFKTLDYSTLGVAIGISLANKAVNHEERIKELERKVEQLEAENRRLRYGS